MFLRVPENCAFTAADQETGRPAPITSSSPENHRLLNSGTVILQPSQAQYEHLLHEMNTNPAVPNMLFFDQDLLAIVYRDRWLPLPYTYNALKTMRTCHQSLWKDRDVKILHYILDKPWKSRSFDIEDPVQSQHRLWWEAFEEVQKDWLDGADEEKRRLWRDVVEPVVVSK